MSHPLIEWSPRADAPVTSRVPAPVASSGAATVRLRLLGQMEALGIDGVSVLPTGRKTRALLAIVALSGPRPMLRGRLAELLWSRRPEEQSRASLRQEIHRLLDVFTGVWRDILVISRDTLLLRPGAVWLDVEEALRTTTLAPASLKLLDRELLEGLDGVDPAFDQWIAAERDRLRDRARSVGEAMIGEQTAPEPLVAAAQLLLAIDGAHEGAWRALMRGHAERGERGMALQSFERCRTALATQLDAKPSPETLRLWADIKAGDGLRAVALPSSGMGPSDRRRNRGGPKIGVLPMNVIGTGPEESRLGLGLADEITAALARFRWMFLVSSASIAQFVQDTRDDSTLRRTFGLDFALDGSIQRVGARLRITLRLVDVRDGYQIVWARRFDRQSEDFLAIQDEVAAEVVAQIDPEIMLIESRRAQQRVIPDGTGYEMLLRAMPGTNRMERGPFFEAEGLLQQAIKLEPDDAMAHASYAWWLQFQIGQGWAADMVRAAHDAGLHAERGVALDSQDARVFAIAGHVRAFLLRRPQEALTLHDRALALNPNLAMAWACTGITYLYLGEWEYAARHLRRYKQLSPMDPAAFHYDAAFSYLAFMQGDFAAAVQAGRMACELNPNFATGCKPLLAALGHLGDIHEATIIRRRLFAIDPGFNIGGFLRSTPFVNAVDRDLFADGLRRAGVPEQPPGD